MSSDIYTCELNQLSDSWGFYVDIENVIPIRKQNHEIIREKYKIKNINKYNKFKNYDDSIKHCETISEEYEYYYKNFNEIDEENPNIVPDKDTTKSMLVKVSSTTFITAILTYFIFFII